VYKSYVNRGVPPGARFDPYGPPGVPGFEPNRFARYGARSSCIPYKYIALMMSFTCLTLERLLCIVFLLKTLL